MWGAQIALVEEAACREGLAAAAAAIVQHNGEKLLEVGLDEAKACLCLCLFLHMGTRCIPRRLLFSPTIL